MAPQGKCLRRRGCSISGVVGLRLINNRAANKGCARSACTLLLIIWQQTKGPLVALAPCLRRSSLNAAEKVLKCCSLNAAQCCSKLQPQTAATNAKSLLISFQKTQPLRPRAFTQLWVRFQHLHDRRHNCRVFMFWAHASAQDGGALWTE